jgi:hypothetical protein
MKRCMIMLLLFFILTADCLTGCFGNHSENTSITSPHTSMTSTAASTTASQSAAATTATSADTSATAVKAGPVDLSIIGTAISTADFGISLIHRSYFYWSPSGQYILFMGIVKNPQDEETSNVYLFRLADKSIIKIMDGEKSGNYTMLTPSWSLDESLLTFSFLQFDVKDYPIYLYHIKTKILEALPIPGFEAAFAPDNSRIALSKMDHSIVVYNLTDQSIDNLGGKVKGCGPIWFSDSRRILFCKQTSSQETDLGTAYQRTLCILDTLHIGSSKLLGSESTIYHLSWIVPDEWVNMHGGWDDGYEAAVLDIKKEQITSYGEGVVCPFRQSGSEFILLVYSHYSETVLLDSSQQRIGSYALDVNLDTDNFDVLPNHNLIFFTVTGEETDMMISYINENRFEQIAYLEGPSSIYLSPDRYVYAFVAKRGTQLLIVNRRDLP